MIYRFLFVLAFSVISCQNNTTPRKIFGSALGTSYQVTYYDNLNEERLKEAMDSIFDVINASMSTYQDNSLLSRLNDGEDVVIDAMFQDVFSISKEVYNKSEGYFDPTVGNLVNAYGFGSSKTRVVVDSILIDSLNELVGFHKLELTKKNKIVKDEDGIYLEFNAIAKGYCLDRMAAYLNSKGIENYLIELGGELIAKGKKQDSNTYWLAGIESPNKDGSRSIAKTVYLKNRAMATSGNYRKFKIDTVTGKKYVHTINPLSGYPEENDMLSASVFAPNCALADAYATAFMAMGYNRSKDLLSELENIDAYFMYLDTLNEIKEYTSSGIKKSIN